MTVRKLTAAALALLMLLPAGCGNRVEQTGGTKPDPSADVTSVAEKGMLVIGVTEFPPLDYSEKDAWTGFDAELAVQFAEHLGVRAEFREIDWNRKAALLENGEIDVIWNGMTCTEELAQTITCSEPYLSNAQVIVMKEDGFERYTTAEACAHLLFACEKGSVGEALLSEKQYRCTACDSQLEAVAAVQEGKTDAAVVDLLMAAFLTGEGTEYVDLRSGYPMSDEEICVGMRKGSSLEAPVNAFLTEAAEDGTIGSIAAKYGLTEALYRQKIDE